MTKKEMMENIDRVMMVSLEMAFEETDLQFAFDIDKGACLGILLTASALGLVSDEEFGNINRTISYMKMSQKKSETVPAGRL